MTERQIQLIEELDFQKITLTEFYNEFGLDLKENSDFIKNEINKAAEKNNSEELNLAIRLILFHSEESIFIDELNELLINPNHTSHQQITKTIQDIGNPSSIPFIRIALESEFDYLEYTCSESDVIAKWFSWALYKIGTDEAIELIKEYSESENDGIKSEMLYRLNKIGDKETAHSNGYKTMATEVHPEKLNNKTKFWSKLKSLWS